MTRQKVPLKDKAIIKKRLAQGQSLRKAIEGTVVKSSSTAKRIKDEESNDIEQLRKDYLLLIEGFGASEIDRAELWAGMTKATKLYGKDSVKHPDWANREKGLRYIDSLRGINTEDKAISKTQVNIFTGLAKEDKKFVEADEV